MFQTSKPKSAAKNMIYRGKKLQDDVLATLSHVASMVGVTLGPGGQQVLIERSEINMKPIMTKDGVTVIKNLGYADANQQLILEAVRDAAVKTANEAGDGTTTATILSNAIAERTSDHLKANPKVSPQRVVREMQKIVPELHKKIAAYRVIPEGEDARNVLLKVATLSANGDSELSEAILEGLDTVGDEGDMTIVEATGPSTYTVQRINGYTVERGYEESARHMANGFINDKSGTMVILEKPLVVLFDGVINDLGQIHEGMGLIHNYITANKIPSVQVAVVAHGFSDTCLGDLHLNWNHAQTKVKVYPMLTPEKSIQNWRTNFLYDLQAYTGVSVFNPIDRPITDLNPEQLFQNCKVNKIEVSRYKTMVFADEDSEAIDVRVNELKLQREHPESEYELNDLNVRIGKLTSGIVRLTISGSSSSETREKRDRADDAWMAVRGAIKHGAVPGGGYVMVRLAADLVLEASKEENLPIKIAKDVLSEALTEPTKVLYRNYGYTEEEITKRLGEMLNTDKAYDLSEEKWVDKLSLLDSMPAVSESIRNSVSIASLLGTLGGIVAFKRDHETDKAEEQFVRTFQAAIGERGSVNQGQD